MQTPHKYFNAFAMLMTALAFLTACSGPKAPETVMDQLVGKWTLPEFSNETRVYYEEWSRLNDTTYRGQAFIVNKETGDQFNSEELIIRFANGNWEYVAKPTGQGETTFKLSELTPEHCRFINPEHDFPKYIQYRWSSPDSLVAEIGDESKTRSFPMVRIDE